MRVALVNSFYYPRGGDCLHVLALERLLVSAGHEVGVFSMRHPDDLPSPWSRYWAANVEFRANMTTVDKALAGSRSVYSVHARRRFARFLDAFRPDVVHLHSIHHHLTVSLVDAAARRRLPLVWTLHDYRTVCPATHLLRAGAPCERCAGGRFWECARGRCREDSPARSAAAAVESYVTRARRTLALIDAYIAPSRFLADVVARMGLPARRTVVLPNFFATSPEEKEALSGATDDLLYVGRLSREKGLDCLIAACRDVHASLRVVGDGPLRAELQALARQSGVAARFDGWLEPAAVRAAMRAARLLCVPSTCYENCPLVVLEAMDVSLPIAASRIGGLPELLDDGRCGWLAEPARPADWAEVLGLALSDRDESTALAAAARRRLAERHGAAAYLSAVEELYAEVGAARGAEP
jgi:glycosyltransferase involved in cell wall biosynthesis